MERLITMMAALQHDGNFTGNDVYEIITRYSKPDSTKEIFVITGRPGPTGKTTLRNRLKNVGYNAIDVSNCMEPYLKKGNHIIPFIDGYIIVLNNLIERLEN